MKIASVGRALPTNVYDQRSIFGALERMWPGDRDNLRRVELLFERVRVRRRHLALPLEAYGDLATFGQSNDAWIACALDLGQRALEEALGLAKLRPEDVDVLFGVSVTGVASPAIDARLMNRMPLRTDMKRVPIFGLGCVAGVAGIARAADYLRGHPDQVAVLLSVELCSLTFQRDDRSMANLISTALFGDGAAAVVMVGAERAKAMGLRGPTVRETRSVFYRDTQDVMGWNISERGFRIVLSESVPTVALERLGPDVRAFLADHGIERDAIARWVCHPGGPRVLEAMQRSLELDDEQVAHSWKVLAEQGNLSSTSALMVLREVLDGPRPAHGDLGLLVAMGPGFCSELVLVEW